MIIEGITAEELNEVTKKITEEDLIGIRNAFTYAEYITKTTKIIKYHNLVIASLSTETELNETKMKAFESELANCNQKNKNIIFYGFIIICINIIIFYFIYKNKN